ncbi:PDDEXK nuclease domain-containing protein [Bacteroidales bacterium OttesenSCG-928-M06]|nr:PDDEXK nuclease domain-containing protein [Bacteroidales bacterium OttesenSCG-928-M06]
MGYEVNKIQSQFEELKSIIISHRNRAYQAINTEIITTNWEVGKYVSHRIISEQWGSGVVDQFAKYLKNNLPELKGFDRSAIYRMVKFYETYSSAKFVAALPPQIKSTDIQINTIVAAVPPQLRDERQIISFLSLINWTSHLEIITGCKTEEEKVFYILLAYKEKLKYRELRRQIESSVYERSLLGEKKQSLKLKETYPTAKQLFKDRYMVDFLNLPENHSEKTLQQGLIQQMKKFILDLGKDFIFMGEEYPIQVGMTDFKIDLLFFHRGLQCLVAIELKTTKFKPEHTGQLDFYLEALDRDVRKENENPSIGILLCKNADASVVEYSLSRSLSPSLIAAYEQKLIPKEVLRAHLNEYYDEVKTTLDDSDEE